MTEGPGDDPAPQEPHGFAMDDTGSDDAASATGFLLDSVRYRRVGRRILSVVIVLLFVSGAGMFTYPIFTDLYTNRIVQERLADDFDAQLGGIGDLRIETFDEWQASVQEGRALTKIVIPDLDVATLVVEGTSPQALRAGAGHYPSTPLPGQDGNVAIAGHRTTYGRPFNRINELETGATIWLVTPVGEYEYEAVGPIDGYAPCSTCASAAFDTGPKDWAVIEQTVEPALTLTTCHPKGSAAQRLVVRAQLVASHPPGTLEG